MTTLFVQSCYVDTEDRSRFTTEYQMDGERVSTTIDDHHASLMSLTSSYPPATGATQPGYVIPEEASPPMKVSTYIGTDGIRHTTMTSQGDGESEQNWQARHDAAHALLQSVFPPAS